ncbi:MAG: family transporter [Acidimicrobiaceae bacterium]|jgi:predicted PurR-regulated permease PerM|nr:family transporter [Acidimicrobiaceae bacterium]
MAPETRDTESRDTVGTIGEDPGSVEGVERAVGDEDVHDDLEEEEPEEAEGEVPLSLRARLGQQGAPFNRKTPFYIGFTGALGVGLAYVVARAVIDLAQVLTLLGISLFLAIGLEPAVARLSRHRMRRPAAVIVIALVFLAFVGGFIAAAVPPISSETHQLIVGLPRYREDLISGKGWIGHLFKQLHLTHVLGTGTFKPKLSWVGGVLGAGKVLLSATTAIVSVLVLTIYFLVTLPAVKRLFLALMPRSRRSRVGLITDDVFTRVGGFVLGNLLTSLVTGVGTAAWLAAFGVPYPVLLGLFVAILDLVPIVGSTIGGIVASLVALTKGLPVALGTAGFYVAYRLFEDYILTPRVMGHTVKISPGLTIVATLIGASLLGLLGALVAIPAAATVQLILAEVTLPRLDRT